MDSTGNFISKNVYFTDITLSLILNGVTARVVVGNWLKRNVNLEICIFPALTSSVPNYLSTDKDMTEC